MFHLAIISSSVRTGRKSHRVALYLHRYLTENQLATAEILDLQAYNFPISEERLAFLPNPSPEIRQFSEKIKNADAVIVVTPEYNHGLPASLKNAIDLLYDEWRRKPVGLATVSSGAFGGVNVLTLLQVIFLRVKAVPSPVYFPVPKVQEAFDEAGQPSDPTATDKRACAFVRELLWFAEAFGKMNA